LVASSFFFSFFFFANLTAIASEKKQ